MSVPDYDMLVSLSEALHSHVSTLLGESVVVSEPDRLNVISEKLEIINLQLAQRKTMRQKALYWLFLSLYAATAAIFVALIKLSSPYLGWNYSNPETALFEATFHVFEWFFIRIAPAVLLMGAILGIFLTLSAPMIKCKKRPRKKCNFVAERREKDRLPIGLKSVRKGSREMKGAQWMDIRSDRQKGLSYVELEKK